MEQRMANWAAIGRRQQETQPQAPQQQAQQPPPSAQQLPQAAQQVPQQTAQQLRQAAQQLPQQTPEHNLPKTQQTRINKPYDKPGNFVKPTTPTTNLFEQGNSSFGATQPFPTQSTSFSATQTLPTHSTSALFLSSTQSCSGKTSADSGSPRMSQESSSQYSDQSRNDDFIADFEDVAEDCKFF